MSVLADLSEEERCPKCDRSFLLLSTYVRHVSVVHSVTDAAWELPKIVHDGVAQVPWGASTGKPSLVNPDAPGECGECPKDGYALPAHPNCQCTPEEGWDEFLTKAKNNRPSNWNENEWNDHLSRLRKEKVK